MSDRLPSWRPGTTRDALLDFLDAATGVPAEERVACIDNDGTLWCEKPQYIQFYFFLDAMRRAVAADPGLGDKPEFAALIGHDRGAMADIGLLRIVMALAGLFAGRSPEEFDSQAKDFMASAQHPDLGRPMSGLRYQPMLELVDELRALDFTISITTAGGTEFVRAISRRLYGVDPALVLGTDIAYDLRDGPGGPSLVRTAALAGVPNEGPPKVSRIQNHLGRRPIFAAGNTSGDQHMMEWTSTGPGLRFALLVDHDDDEREFAYEGGAATFEAEAPILEVANQRGWTVASMRDDWDVIFADPA